MAFRDHNRQHHCPLYKKDKQNSILQIDVSSADWHLTSNTNICRFKRKTCSSSSCGSAELLLVVGTAGVVLCRRALLTQPPFFCIRLSILVALLNIPTMVTTKIITSAMMSIISDYRFRHPSHMECCILLLLKYFPLRIQCNCMQLVLMWY